ncbi:ABC transporter ATP-binding protein (plasmid) [Haloferacaceae archaeon DSL9]
MNAIETHSLTKRYGDTVAVDDLSLSIPGGAVYGFLGPNGAGKTTTMRMLATLLRPTSGRATIAGHSIDDRAAVTDRIGYLPEKPPLYDELTGREQLEYLGRLRSLPADVVRERIDRHAETLALAADLDDRIETYSKGMRQKTAFIQTLLHEPDVLFLDEPTEGLDPRAARALRTLIDELADGGATIFLSTHILPIVDEHADTVGVLSDGRLVAEGSPTELKRRADKGAEQSLEDVFLEVTGELDSASVAADD